MLGEGGFTRSVMTEYSHELTLLNINVYMVKRSRDINGVTLFVTPDIFKYQFVCLYDIHRNLFYLNRYVHASIRLFKTQYQW